MISIYPQKFFWGGSCTISFLLVRKRELDQDGNPIELIELVKEMGFKIGHTVQRAQDKLVGTIDSMTGSLVFLQFEDGLYQIGAQSFIQGEWKILKKSSKVLEFSYDQFKDHCGHQNRHLKHMETEGKIATTLLGLEAKHHSVLQHVKIVLQPSRNVVVTESFGEGKLCLVPSTGMICLRPKDNAIYLGIVDGDEWYLHPYFSGPDKDGGLKEVSFLSPFWLVRKTSVEEDSNIEIKGVIPDGGNNPNLKIPLLRNKKALEAGDILVLYVPKVPEAPCEKPVKVAANPPPKRQRTKGPEKSK